MSSKMQHRVQADCCLRRPLCAGGSTNPTTRGLVAPLHHKYRACRFACAARTCTRGDEDANNTLARPCFHNWRLIVGPTVTCAQGFRSVESYANARPDSPPGLVQESDRLSHPQPQVLPWNCNLARLLVFTVTRSAACFGDIIIRTSEPRYSINLSSPCAAVV